MWWECTQCSAGGNSPIAHHKHEEATGHTVKVVYDSVMEE